MNVLSDSARLCVLAALVEGNSLRATERLTGVCRKAVTDLLVEVGDGCGKVHDTLTRSRRAWATMSASRLPRKVARDTGRDHPWVSSPAK
jgi:hypothetical protein